MESIVLSSGGVDSTVVLARAMVSDAVMSVSFEYGQRHMTEIERAKAVADYYGIEHHVLKVPLFPGQSVLMDAEANMPQMTYEELEEAEGPSPTYVPFRNGNLLSVATAFALEVGADTLWCGMHAEDARGWAYPDCTPEFIGAMQNAIYIGTYHKVRLLAPLTYMMKPQVVRLGLELGVPFHLTYSCYEGREISCGRCPTCISRLEAFRKNNAQDPIEYEFDAYRRGQRGKE